MPAEIKEKNSIILLSLNNCGLTAIPDLTNLEKLCYFSAANNNITTVNEGAFKKNEKLSVIDLSGNTGLSTVPANDFGVYTATVNEGLPNSRTNVPVNLKSLNLDGCTSLEWTVPSSWCCLEGDIMFGGNGDKQLPDYPVIVYNRDAPGVTYAKCWNDDCPFRHESDGHYQLDFAKEFDEIWADLHK